MKKNKVPGRVKGFLAGKWPKDVKDTLIPCPFCGSDAVLTTVRERHIRGREFHFGICTNMNCACALNPVPHKEQAVKMWNTRVIQLRAVRVNNTVDLRSNVDTIAKNEG